MLLAGQLTTDKNCGLALLRAIFLAKAQGRNKNFVTQYFNHCLPNANAGDAHLQQYVMQNRRWQCLSGY